VLAILAGAVLGILTLVVLTRVSRVRAELSLAVLLGLAAGVYVGTTLSAGLSGALVLQSVGALLFALLAVLGLGGTGAFLGVAWLLHAGWDALILQGSLVAHAPAWYPGACVAYDVVVGAELLLTGLRAGLGRKAPGA
jgi:Family of unknown function (DUF6010)